MNPLRRLVSWLWTFFYEPAAIAEPAELQIALAAPAAAELVELRAELVTLRSELDRVPVGAGAGHGGRGQLAFTPPAPPPAPPPPASYPQVVLVRQEIEYREVDLAISTVGDRLTPERWVSICRDADNGYTAPLMDVYEARLLADGHLRGLFEARADEPVNADMQWSPAQGDNRPASIAVADVLAESSDEDQLGNLVQHLMWARFAGYSYIEIEWVDRGDGWIVPGAYLCPPLRRFHYDRDGRPRLFTRENMWPGEELVAGRFHSWILGENRRFRTPSRSGLLRTATVFSMFKGTEWRDWLIAAQKYGIPFLFGIYDDEASEKQKAELTEAVKKIGTEGRAIMSTHTSVEVNDQVSKGSSSETIPERIIRAADDENSRLITGATLTTGQGGPGSFALGTVHETRGHKLSAGDARWIFRTTATYIGKEMLRRNGLEGKASPPGLRCHVRQQMDPATESTVYVNLSKVGLTFSAKQLRSKFALNAPIDAADTVAPAPKTAPGDPNGKPKSNSDKPAAGA
jgi:phage gp29-like protein